MKMFTIATTIVLSCFAFPLTAKATPTDPSELVFAFQKQKDPAAMRTHADTVAAFLSEKLRMRVKAYIPTDYAASVQAMVSGTADIAYIDSLPFLLARRDANAQIILAEERVDINGNPRTEYDSIFVAAKDSPLNSVAEIIAKHSDINMVFTSPTSTSGYIMPYRRFVSEGLLKPQQDVKEVFKSVAFAGGYTQALEQVLSGRGDVCAVSNYTMEGPGAASFLPDDKRVKLKILGRTPGVPTHVIAARGGLSKELLAKTKDALLTLAAEHPELLRDVYGATRLVPVDEDRHVLASAQAVEYLGLPIDGIVQAKKGS